MMSTTTKRRTSTKRHNNRSSKLYCGCEWIDVPYDQQLERKQNAIKQLLEPLNDTPFPTPTLHAIIPMDSDNPRAFRHKIVTPFAPLQAKTHRTQPRRNAAQTAAQRKPTHRECAHIACGFYMPGTHTIVPCFNCPSEPRVGRKLLNYLAKTASELGISAYDEDKHTGLLRHALLRISKHDGSILCVLVTNGVHIPQRKALISRLLKRFPAICSIVQNINTRRTNAVLSSTNRVLFGSGFVKDTLLGAQFSIGATTFFQTNPAQTERLYLCAIRALQKLDVQKPATPKIDVQKAAVPNIDVQKPAVPQFNAPQSEMQTLSAQPSVTFNPETRPANSIPILDAYCGCGTISVCVAKHLPHAYVLGVDQVEQSIECARKNAQANHVKKRCSFICADATQFMHELRADMRASTREHACSPLTTQDEATATCPFDCIIMDPPRSGSTPEFIEGVAHLQPRLIVYISCNPKTMVRDILQFQEFGYTATDITPVDMFPHTPHVKTVVLMSKTD